MKQFKDLTGKRFGRLQVLKLDHKQQKVNKNGIKTGNVYYWLCQCDCGNIKVIRGSHLTKGLTQSCGCLQKEAIANISKKTRATHNQSDSRIYRIYKHMINRCYRTNTKDFLNYGGRGILVCEEWKNDFITFYNWSMSNGYKENLTIDRIDCNGNYEPSNCRWITKEQQGKNTRKIRNLTYNGKTYNVREWANLLNISVYTLYDRLNRGWSIEKTLSTPAKTPSPSTI